MNLIRRSAQSCWLPATVMALLTPAAAGLTIYSVTPTSGPIGVYEPFVVTFRLSESYENPYDPEEVDVSFEFIGPSGVPRVIPAFWAGPTVAWTARIVPLEPGLHTGRILVSDFAGRNASHTLLFTAVESSARGFVRIDPKNPRYLRFDNGEPYWPVGHNVCWYGGNAVFDTYLQELADAGGNWTRYWMVPYVSQGIEWGGGVEGEAAGLGRYSQNNSALLDNMINAAADRGLYVQLCLDSYNGWNLTLWDNWSQNPYNEANGGMLARPVDYFTDPQARKLARQRFRYIVARWAYSTAVLCWEFFNEVDAVSGGGASFWDYDQEIADWHRDMAQYIRSIDPFDHLRTTSFADDGWTSSYYLFWQLPEMDIVQVHEYHPLLPQAHVSKLRDRQQFGKPVILGESDDAGTPGDLDPDGESLHQLIWAAAVSESGSMSWWWDGWIHPKFLYPIYEPLVAWWEGEDWAEQQLAPIQATVLTSHYAVVYGSAGPQYAYAYIDYVEEGEAVGLRLRLSQLQPGDFRVEYWDTWEGTIIETQDVVAGGSGLELDVPTFVGDLAVKVRALGPLIAVAPATLAPVAHLGGDAAGQVFTVANSGAGTLNYTVSDDAEWLEASPAGGSSSGEVDNIHVSYDTNGLDAGEYSASITVADDGALNSPRTIPVTLTISPAPGDFDLDGDVDLTDHGHLQWCLSGPGIILTDPDCFDADLTGDRDVDQEDVAVFRGCLSGADVPADPYCKEP